MNCNKCNSLISENSNFCPNCGSKVFRDNKEANIIKKESSGINPVYILVIAGFVAILVIVLILDSNTGNQAASNINTNQNQEQLQTLSKIDQLKDQLKTDPENVNLYIELGNNLFDVQKYNEVIPNYRKALDFNPQNVEVRIDLAVAYYNLQIADTALFEIKKALAINPDHQQGLYNLGVMYYNIGEKDKAKESWTKLIKLHDGSRAAETAKQLLENI